MVDALTRFQNEQRSIDYIKLDTAQAGTIDPPSPETLAAYFEDHKVQFRAPEYRKLSFAITPEEVGKWSFGFRRRSQEDLRRAQGQIGHDRTAARSRRSSSPPWRKRRQRRNRINASCLL